MLPIGSHFDHHCGERLRAFLEEFDQVVVRAPDADSPPGERLAGKSRTLRVMIVVGARAVAAAAWTRSSGSCPGIKAMRCS
ncbi:MAG TPA: hypothetical protein VNG13_14100 [Mycobacteriales bacterium]|nr:hypothetical protein [Mycobacteriales bacterium]